MSCLSQVSFLEVWRRLGGPEIRRGRAPAWWRESSDLNVSVNAERGVFYDHAQHRGGGVLALVATVLNCDRTAALAWLEARGFIGLRTLTHEQRREYAKRRNESASAALDIEHWRNALVLELNERKVAAVAANDDASLNVAACLCNLLENGSAHDVIREFIRQRMTAPEAVARLVAAGGERDYQDQWFAAQIVLLLARAVELEAPRDAQ